MSLESKLGDKLMKAVYDIIFLNVSTYNILICVTIVIFNYLS